jgi:hypothetical protein
MNKRTGRETVYEYRPVYSAWQTAKQRTTNPNNSAWSLYGGRGITMCEHWLNDFDQFSADMGSRPDETSLERKDNNLGYLCPRCHPPIGNCCWATAKEQANNTRTVEKFVALLTTAPEHDSSARGVPSCNWRAHWLTVNEFARMMDRRPFTIHTWLRNGTLAEFGIPVCHFRCGGLHSGRTFIQNVY